MGPLLFLHLRLKTLVTFENKIFPRYRWCLLIVALVSISGCQKPASLDSEQASPTPPQVPPEPFIGLVQSERVWAFVKGDQELVGLGVNVIRPKEEAPRDPQKAYHGLAKHGGNIHAWAQATAERLKDWGFDTVGAWSDEAMYQVGVPYTRVVWLGGHSGHGRTADKRLVDVWDPDFAQRVAKQAEREVAPFANDSNLLGFFINNELPFYGEFGWPTDPDKSLWDRYMALSENAPGRVVAAAFFQSYYENLEKAQEDWEITSFEQLHQGPPPVAKSLGAQRFKHEWAGCVADKYFALCAGEIRRLAPRHLLLGSRHAGRPIAAVVRSEAKYVDVISINHYSSSGHPDLTMLRNLHALTGRPILITEFSWRAMENRSGNTNQKGAEVTVVSQADRAARYRTYVSEWMREPYAIGAHWFQYYDQPADGRSFDGENSNYGIVDIEDRPYEELTDAMRETNLAVAASRSQRRMPEGGFSFDPETWGELAPVALMSGPLEAPVNLDLTVVDFLIHSDAGNEGSIDRPESGGLRVSYQTGTGWGLHADASLPSFPAGARSLKIRLQGTSGHRFRIFLTEDGDGPPGLQVYSGRDGADGESFEYSPFIATGEAQEITVALEEATVRRFWGNQRGDRKLATGGLRTFSLFVFPGQGSGEVTLHSIAFLP